MPTSPNLLINVFHLSVLVVVKPVSHVRVMGPQEEHVPGSLMLVCGVSELDNVVLAGGGLGLADLGQLSSEHLVLQVEF